MGSKFKFKLLVSYLVFSFRRIAKDVDEYSIGRSGNDFEISYLLEHFRGKKIWNRENKRDWLIWSKQLYAPNLIIVGGFLGNSTKLFIERISNISKIHVYEPIPKHFKSIVETVGKFERVSAFNEGIYTGEKALFDISEDATLLSGTGREIPSHLIKEHVLTVDTISIKEAVARITLDNPNSAYSLYMNCEGSEYLILEQMLKLENTAQSIIVQTHTTGAESYQKLYKLRSLLAVNYIPIFTADWAWDVLIKNELVSRTPASIEQDSF